MPTMAGAFAYDLYKSRAQLTVDNTLLVAVGFAMSFVCAWIVVKTLPRLRDSATASRCSPGGASSSARSG